MKTQDETDENYSEWAATYDEEVKRHGYRTAERCAAALARFVPATAPILDIGCGTGISGAALAAAGFADVTGQLESGVAEHVLSERGPHFEGLGTQSTVYVLRRH